GLAGNTVLALSETSGGDIWVGTDNGLSRWHGDKFVSYTVRQGLSHNAINSLLLDAQDVLWIGTRGVGLNRLKGASFTAYTTRSGLFSDEIYEVLEDDFGYLWMSCDKGIFRVNKKDFDELDRGAIKTLTSTPFGKADGLASVQCNGTAK